MAEGILIALFAVATFFATAFPVGYLLLPWHSTPQGRAIMNFAASKALMMNVLLLFTFWQPESYWVEWGILFVAVSLLAITATYRTMVLVHDIRSHWTPPPPADPVSTDLSGTPEEA
jgi:hypothetical protein